jgi:uncharacterized protein (DUF2147 family)
LAWHFLSLGAILREFGSETKGYEARATLAPLMKGTAMLLTKRMYVIAAAIAAALAAPTSARPASIEGSWRADDGKSVIEFYPCGEAMCGRIARFLVPEPAGGARDGKNSDKALRDRKLLGLRVFWSLAPGAARFKGKGYSPEDGRNFNAEIWREGNRLKVKGCVLVLCRTAGFSRA